MLAVGWFVTQLLVAALDRAVCLCCRSPFTGHSLRSFANAYLLSWQAVRVFVGWFALHVRISVTARARQSRSAHGMAIDSSFLCSSLSRVRLIACHTHIQVLLYFILPGQVVDGVPIDAKGTRLKYPLNGQTRADS